MKKTDTAWCTGGTPDPASRTRHERYGFRQGVCPSCGQPIEMAVGGVVKTHYPQGGAR